MLTAPGIYGCLIAAAPSGPLPMGGINSTQLASALAATIQAWGVGNPVNLGLTGLASGTAGVGTVAAGKVTVPPDVSAVLGGLAGAGFNGPGAPSMASMVAVGLSNAFSTLALYAGPSPTVGVGADVSKITVVNTGLLASMLTGQLTVQMGAGTMTSSLAMGLASGITMLLLKGTGVGTVAGVPAIPPFPASGLTSSAVV